MKYSILTVSMAALAANLAIEFTASAGGGDEADACLWCVNNCWNTLPTAAPASCAKSCGPAPRAAFTSSHGGAANDTRDSVLTLHCLGSMQTTQLPDGRIVPFRIPTVAMTLKPAEKTLTFTSGRANYQAPFTPPTDAHAGVEELAFQIRQLTEHPQFPTDCVVVRAAKWRA